MNAAQQLSLAREPSSVAISWRGGASDVSTWSMLTVVSLSRCNMCSGLDMNKRHFFRLCWACLYECRMHCTLEAVVAGYLPHIEDYIKYAVLNQSAGVVVIRLGRCQTTLKNALKEKTFLPHQWHCTIMLEMFSCFVLSSNDIVRAHSVLSHLNHKNAIPNPCTVCSNAKANKPTLPPMLSHMSLVHTYSSTLNTYHHVISACKLLVRLQVQHLEAEPAIPTEDPLVRHSFSSSSCSLSQHSWRWSLL